MSRLGECPPDSRQISDDSSLILVTTSPSPGSTGSPVSRSTYLASALRGGVKPVDTETLAACEVQNRFTTHPNPVVASPTVVTSAVTAPTAPTRGGSTVAPGTRMYESRGERGETHRYTHPLRGGGPTLEECKAPPSRSAGLAMLDRKHERIAWGGSRHDSYLPIIVTYSRTPLRAHVSGRWATSKLAPDIGTSAVTDT